MLHRKSFFLLLILLVLCLLSPAALAQESSVPPACPALVQEAFTATELLCEERAPGEICLGNGVAEHEPLEQVAFDFSRPGDLAPFTDFQSLRLRSLNTENAVWAVAQFSMTARTIGGGSGTVDGLIFGDVSLTNTGASQGSGGIPLLNGTVTSGGGLLVRQSPASDATVVWQLTAQETVLVTGRTADNAWLRIDIPSRFGGPGWVAAGWMSLSDDISTLMIASAQSPPPDIAPPEFGSMQMFTFQSSLTDPACEETPHSGIMLQSASGLMEELKMRINGADISFSGTLFLRAQAGVEMVVTVLEGQGSVSVSDTTRSLTAGLESSVPLSIDLGAAGPPDTPRPFDTDDYQFLPIRILPRTFLLMAAGDLIEAQPEAPASAQQPAADVNCMLTAPPGENKNMRSGPGVHYPVTAYLEPGRPIRATGQTRDEFQYIWYQTTTGHWVRYDIVEREGDCSLLPTATPPPIPTPSEPQATATAAASGRLFSSVLGDICSVGHSFTSSDPAPGDPYAISLGGTWTARAGVAMRVTVSGSVYRGEYGDFIRIVAANGDRIAGSGNVALLEYTFPADTQFTLEFSAAIGNVVRMDVVCLNP